MIRKILIASVAISALCAASSQAETDGDAAADIGGGSPSPDVEPRSSEEVAQKGLTGGDSSERQVEAGGIGTGGTDDGTTAEDEAQAEEASEGEGDDTGEGDEGDAGDGDGSGA